MKTLTIRLPDWLMKRIEQHSLARRVSKSEIVRECLAVLPPAPWEHPLADILEASWELKVPASPPQFRSPHKQKLAEIIRAKKLQR